MKKVEKHWLIGRSKCEPFFAETWLLVKSNRLCINIFRLFVFWSNTCLDKTSFIQLGWNDALLMNTCTKTSQKQPLFNLPNVKYFSSTNWWFAWTRFARPRSSWSLVTWEWANVFAYVIATIVTCCC